MSYVITRSCCNDASCVTVCPVNCIHPTPEDPDFATAEMLYIDPVSCIDCGACLPVCPVEAIVADTDLTEENRRYADINARYFFDPEHAQYEGASAAGVKPPRFTIHQSEPLRVAIVGSGPAGCYAAEELLTQRGLNAEVHLFDRSASPWGLVRFGVAPDHQDTKTVIRQFSRTAVREGLSLHLNVELGKHLTHEELLDHHHAVVYAVGASQSRSLGIPGESLPGSHSATDFVAWYNGNPAFADLEFDLSGERAVVVGNGNVALDVARILASDPERLATTDIADHALAALAASNVKDVLLLGRRGPQEAAFSIPELLELADRPDFDVLVDEEMLSLDPDSVSMTGLKVELVQEIARRPRRGTAKSVTLRFLRSPMEILGDERVSGVRVARNELVVDGDRTSVRATGEVEDIECGLVLRSIGYRGTPVPGVPFDEGRGTLPNDMGRVLDPETGRPVDGVYATGWIKRGPSGVIGTNKRCAQETAQALLQDYLSGRLAAPKHHGEELRRLIAERQPEAIDYAGWQAIDRHEVTTAAGLGRPRVKSVDVAEMLTIARSSGTRP